MNILKYFLSLSLCLSFITLSSCSSIDTPISVNNNTSENLKYTENTDMTTEEIQKVQQLINNYGNKSELSDSSFDIKTAQAGEDVEIDMLLLNPKAAKRAKFWGIDTAAELLNAGKSPSKRWFLNIKLGGLFPSDAFKAYVLFWVERADLLRVKSVSLDDSFLLVMAGITSAPHLARCNNPIDQGALNVQLSLLAFNYGLPIPSMSKIETWTKEATTLKALIY